MFLRVKCPKNMPQDLVQAALSGLASIGWNLTAMNDNAGMPFIVLLLDNTDEVSDIDVERPRIEALSNRFQYNPKLTF